MNTPHRNLDGLMACMEAALEHVPPRTRAMIASMAEPHMMQLRAHLDQAGKAPATAAADRGNNEPG